jgi:hypothetical protein
MDGTKRDRARPPPPLEYEPKPASDPAAPDGRWSAAIAMACGAAWWASLAWALLARSHDRFVGTPLSYALFAYLAVGSVSTVVAYLHEGRVPWPTRVAAGLLGVCWAVTIAMLAADAVRAAFNVNWFAFPF